MKVWPIDPLVPRNLRLEVPEKLPQGLANCPWNEDVAAFARLKTAQTTKVLALHLVLGMFVGGTTPINHPEVTESLRPQH